MYVLLRSGFDLSTASIVNTYSSFIEAQVSMKSFFFDFVNDELCLEDESVVESVIEAFKNGTENITIGNNMFELVDGRASAHQLLSCYGCNTPIGYYPIREWRIFRVG